MIWIYLMFGFLFLNELGFIAYQTYLYNVMCMDLWLDGDYSETYSIIESIWLEQGMVSLEMGEVTYMWELFPVEVLEVMESLGGEKNGIVYHINFTSQVYPKNEELHFQVLQRHIYTAPGDLTLVFFHMENVSTIARHGVTIYTISPFYLSYYVQKIQCFCFEELEISGSQALELPVIFYIDPLMENANWYSLTVEYLYLWN